MSSQLLQRRWRREPIARLPQLLRRYRQERAEDKRTHGRGQCRCYRQVLRLALSSRSYCFQHQRCRDCSRHTQTPSNKLCHWCRRNCSRHSPRARLHAINVARSAACRLNPRARASCSWSCTLATTVPCVTGAAVSRPHAPPPLRSRCLRHQRHKSCARPCPRAQVLFAI